MWATTGTARAVERKVGGRRRTLAGLGLVATIALGGALASGPGPSVSAAPGDEVSSLGTEFWLAFNRNYTGGTLTLFITGPTATTGTVEVPGIGLLAPFTVTPGTVTSVPLPGTAELPNPGAADTLVARGIHVTAASDIAVYGLNQITFTTDAFLGLPVSSLGTDYRVLSYPSTFSSEEVSVVGTVDDTTVTVTPVVPLGSHPAGVPYTQVVDRGQVLMLPQSVGAPGVTGTRVQSSAPTAVFAGNACVNIPASSVACDHIVEQLTPTSTWGRRFVTTPLASRLNGDTFRILADTPGTEVRINGTLVATLGAGQYHEQILATSSLVEASQPILVAQYANGTSFDNRAGDPFMMLVPPYEQFLNSYTVTTPATGFAAHYVSVVAPNGSTVSLDGSPIPAASFAPVGSSGYSAASLQVSPGTHTLSSAQPFGLAIYGFNNADSYGYTGGIGLSEVATVAKVVLTPETGTAQVGTQQCVTGRALTATDVPVPAVRIDFVVTGVNPTSGFGTTDANGAVDFCYTGANAGSDTITGTVSGISDTATRTWTSAPPVNTPPTANSQSVTTDEGVPVAITLTGSDPDAGTTLSFAVARPPASGTLSGSGANLTYTPNAGFVGADSFTFTANDGQADSAPATVSITVRAVDDSNDPPIAKSQAVSTRVNRAVKIVLVSGDPNNDPTTETVTSQPAHGTLVPEAWYFVYTPNPGFEGFDSFTFTASDDKATSAPGTVHIKVGNPPPPPVELRASDDPARSVDVRALNGSTFVGGEPIYAFVGPSDVFNYIDQVSFWIDDPSRSGAPFMVDGSKEYDLAKTAGGGLAHAVESNLLSVGPHTVTALVAYKNHPPVVLSATINVADTSAHRLLVSSAADRSGAVDLAGGTLSGNRYVFLGPVGDAITGLDQVAFSVDGTQVRTDKTVEYDLVGNNSRGALAYDTRQLANGSHVIAATVTLQGGAQIVYRSTFTVAN